MAVLRRLSGSASKPIDTLGLDPQQRVGRVIPALKCGCVDRPGGGFGSRRAVAGCKWRVAIASLALGVAQRVLALVVSDLSAWSSISVT